VTEATITWWHRDNSLVTSTKLSYIKPG